MFMADMCDFLTNPVIKQQLKSRLGVHKKMFVCSDSLDISM